MNREYLAKVVVVCLVVLLCAGWVSGQDWCQWRGANRDGKAGGFVAHLQPERPDARSRERLQLKRDASTLRVERTVEDLNGDLADRAVRRWLRRVLRHDSVGVELLGRVQFLAFPVRGVRARGC